jgi:hypothetical protein
MRNHKTRKRASGCKMEREEEKEIEREVWKQGQRPMYLGRSRVTHVRKSKKPGGGGVLIGRKTWPEPLTKTQPQRQG